MNYRHQPFVWLSYISLDCKNTVVILLFVGIFSLAHMEVRGQVQLQNSSLEPNNSYSKTPAELLFASIGVLKFDHLVESLTSIALFSSSNNAALYNEKNTCAGVKTPPLYRPLWGRGPAAVLECCQALDVIIRTRLRKLRIPSNRNQTNAKPEDFNPLPLWL